MGDAQQIEGAPLTEQTVMDEPNYRQIIGGLDDENYSADSEDRH